MKKRRTARTIPHGTCRVVIRRDSTWQEWQVKTFVGNRAAWTYHAEDVADARGTAAAQVRWLRAHRRRACKA